MVRQFSNATKSPTLSRISVPSASINYHSFKYVCTFFIIQGMTTAQRNAIANPVTGLVI